MIKFKEYLEQTQKSENLYNESIILPDQNIVIELYKKAGYDFTNIRDEDFKLFNEGFYQAFKYYKDKVK